MRESGRRNGEGTVVRAKKLFYLAKKWTRQAAMMQSHAILETLNRRVIIAQPFSPDRHRVQDTLVCRAERIYHAIRNAPDDALAHRFYGFRHSAIDQDLLTLLDEMPCRS